MAVYLVPEPRRHWPEWKCALCGAPCPIMSFPGGLHRSQPCPCEPTGERHRYDYPTPAVEP